MTPPVLPSLPGLAWSRHKKPGFSTRVASHVSGREVRLPLMSYPLYEFETAYTGLASAAAASTANLGASSLQTLMGFFLQSLGQAGVFLYTDPDDNTVLGQSIGAGDGTTQQFVISRTLGGFSEPVSYVTAVNAVYLNGAAQPSNEWLFTAPNMLAFASPPGAGVAIAADFSFAFQCRFFDDQLDFEEFMSALWKLDSVKFRSIKPNTSAAAALIPSWYSPYQLGGTIPYAFADFTTQGTTNHYLYNGNTYSSGAAWLTAAGGVYSNATGKYVTNASGLLASVAANTLPFNHDVSGNVLGLLLEGASTNYASYSQGHFSSQWAGAGPSFASVSDNSQTAPDGTATASTFVGTTSGGRQQSNSTCAVPTTTGTLTVSLYLRGASGGEGVKIGFYTNTNGVALGTANTLTTSWQRFTFTSAFNNADNSFYGQISAAAGSQTFYAWGFQVEVSPLASSYIPTTGSPASRAADSLYLPWSATTFTVRLKATLAAQVNGDYLADTGHGLLTEAAGPDAQTSNGTNTLTTGIAAFTSSNIIVVGGSSSGRVLSANGNAAASDSNALVPSAGTEFYLGQSSAATSQANGTYAQVGLWNAAATAAQAATNSGTA